jgi:hypothetical protein
MTRVRTAREVAQTFRCSTRQVTDTAASYGIVASSGSPTGLGFNEADVEALWKAMRPRTAVSSQKRGRRPRATGS